MDDFNVPIALFNFNRPQHTRSVFEIVRQIKPSRLLLVSDGPRANKPEDAHLCAEVRAIFEEIDWKCNVSRNFSDTNLGSFKRNSSGLNWVFDTVEEAIILEDDCLPSLSFFRYCKELLERYRNDKRIGVISGNNFVAPGAGQGDYSYFFSAYALTWGWATWRRVWQQVDLTMSRWEEKAGKEMLRALHPQSVEWKYWLQLYGAIHSGQRKNAWDYQLILSSFRHSQLCIIPNINLISNTGYGVGATHCMDDSSRLANISRGDLEFPLIHPVSVVRCEEMDHAIFNIRILDHSTQPSLIQRAITRSQQVAIRIIASLLPETWKARIKKMMGIGEN